MRIASGPTCFIHISVRGFSTCLDVFVSMSILKTILIDVYTTMKNPGGKQNYID